MILPLLFQFTKDCNAPANPALIPLPECVSYQGYPGGLYAGTNDRPMWLEGKRVTAMQGIVPRDAQGNPDPNGSVVVLTIGQSYSFAVFNFAAQYADADPLKSRALHFVCAASGAGAETMIDPSSSYWTHVADVIAASPYTAAQVQILWLMTTHLGTAADPYGVSPWGVFPEHAQTLEADILSIVDNLPFLSAVNLSNIAAVYLSPRMTARYGDPTSPLLPVPYDYELGFGDQWAVLDQQGTYIDWASYWFSEDDPCPWYSVDGVHLSPAGAAHFGDVLWKWMRRRSWYL